MEALTYSYTRTHLAQVMRSVNEDRAPVLVTTQRGKPVVIMSLDDYNALEETAYLLRSPKGAKRLMESVEQLRALDKPLARRILDYLDERVIGSIEDGVMRVLVLQIGNRREVYR